ELMVDQKRIHRRGRGIEIGIRLARDRLKRRSRHNDASPKRRICAAAVRAIGDRIRRRSAGTGGELLSVPVASRLEKNLRTRRKVGGVHFRQRLPRRTGRSAGVAVASGRAYIIDL